jgi:hypothetical protein
MIGKNLSGSELPYKKMLKGRLGIRTPRDMQQHSNVSLKTSELPGSQTFRSTMEILNGRCGSLSARISKSASSSEVHHVSESVSSWYKHRTQAISALSAPSFGFCQPVDGENGAAGNIASNVPLRPQSTGQALTRPLTGVSDVPRRPTTTNVINEPKHARDTSGTLAKLSAVATQLSTASSFREPNQSAVQAMNNPSIEFSSTSPKTLPTPEQAKAEVTKGQSLKKFSHVSQRAIIKVFRVNPNAELLIDEVLHEKVVSIFDGLSPYSPPKKVLNSEEDFIPFPKLVDFQASCSDMA